MMKRPKKVLPPKATIAMFGVAVAMLLFSSVGGARAALTYYSETYSSRVQMDNIGVTLQENGEPISWRNYSDASDGSWEEAQGVLLGGMLQEDEKVQLGRTYQEELSVVNSGDINQYVRVSIYKYWMDEEGNKLQSLSPDLIHLHFTNLETDWLIDEEASTSERTVLYYNKLLYAPELGNSETPLLTDTISIDGQLATKVSQKKEVENGYTTITTTYDYDGVQFRVEAKVDAVQEHNAEDAIWSAWGRRVSVNDGVLSLR